MTSNLILELSSKGYWPAVAMEYLADKKYSRAIELCLIRLNDNPEIISGRIVLGRALYHSGQYEASEEQFYHILQNDPNNLVALRYMGDLKYRRGDEATAMSYYRRVREMTPDCISLSSSLENKPIEETRVLTLRRSPEKVETERGGVRQIPFRTETLGDLLLAQGHPRLAQEIYQGLLESSDNPRLAVKLDKTRELIRNKENKDAAKEN